ncbi:MAG: ATP synthase F1 subunit epsilon [Armatimonadota bacterium]
MPDGIKVRILTPMGEVLDTIAIYVRAPAPDGLFGVMARHAPMVADLTIGATRVTGTDGALRYFATTNGVLRVSGEEVLVLVDAAEEADRIDIERAHRALERARHRLAAAARGAVDVARAELALARAMNRLRVAEQVHR